MRFDGRARRLCCGALAVLVSACTSASFDDAGRRDAFVTRDAWRPPRDAYLPPLPDTGPPPSDAGTDAYVLPDVGHDVGPLRPDADVDAGPRPCTPTLAPTWPSPSAIVPFAALAVRNAGALPIEFDVCTDPTCSVLVRSSSGTSLSWTVTPPLAEGRYYWRATDATGATTPPRALRIHAGASWNGWPPVDVDDDGLADIVACIPDVLGWVPSHLVTVCGAPAGAPGRRGRGSVCRGVVASAGDLNGDGFTDVAMPFLSDGTIAPRAVLGDACALLSSDAITIGPVPMLNVLSQVIGLGDVDHDGLDDVLDTKTIEWGFLGDLTPHYECDFDVRYGDRTSPGLRGDALAPIRDGGPCVAAALRSASGGIVIGMPSSNQVWIYGRGTSAAPFEPMLLIAGPSGVSSFGADVVDAGDIDGDGAAEVAVTQAVPSGIRFVDPIRGGVSALVPVSLTEHDQHGARLAALGDFDGDGRNDVAVGGADDVYIAFGDASGLATLVRLGFGAPDVYGWIVASPGDVDGDGFGDLVVPSNDYVYLVRGGGRMPRAERYARIGYPVAGDALASH